MALTVNRQKGPGEVARSRPHLDNSGRRQFIKQQDSKWAAGVVLRWHWHTGCRVVMVFPSPAPQLPNSKAPHLQSPSSRATPAQNSNWVMTATMAKNESPDGAIKTSWKLIKDLTAGSHSQKCELALGCTEGNSFRDLPWIEIEFNYTFKSYGFFVSFCTPQHIKYIFSKLRDAYL